MFGNSSWSCKRWNLEVNCRLQTTTWLAYPEFAKARIIGISRSSCAAMIKARILCHLGPFSHLLTYQFTANNLGSHCALWGNTLYCALLSCFFKSWWAYVLGHGCLCAHTCLRMCMLCACMCVGVCGWLGGLRVARVQPLTDPHPQASDSTSVCLCPLSHGANHGLHPFLRAYVKIR